MDSHSAIEDQAAAFLAQRDSGDWTTEQQAQLDQWLADSIARRVAYLRLETVWEEARRLKAVCAGLPVGIVPAPGTWQHSPFFGREAGVVSSRLLPGSFDTIQDLTPHPHCEDELSTAARSVSTVADENYSPSRRSRLQTLSIVAMLMVAGVAGSYWFTSERWSGDRYTTPIGGFSSVPLRDGSRIMLNTATQVRIELTAQERGIQLDHGEAFFQVAHDTIRPFVVHVGRKRVIAVGTQFSVRRNGDDIRVVVTEGKVRVESEGRSPQSVASLSLRTDQRRLGEAFVTPGEIASAGDEGIVVEDRGLPAVQDDLSWRLGYLTFHDTSLQDAIAEFNRYNAHQIKIDDPQISLVRISGTFRALNYDAFVRILDDGFGIHARTIENLTTLTR